MGVIQDLFTEAAGDDVSVAADQAKLAADTAADVAAHKGLVDAVVANGPTAFIQPDGSIVGLVPQPDGTLMDIVFKDGASSQVTPPAPAPTPPAPPSS